MDRFTFYDRHSSVGSTEFHALGGSSTKDARHAADMRGTFVRSLLSLLRVRGLDPEKFVRGLGFRVEDVDQPTCMLSFSQSSRLAQRVVDRLGQPCLGVSVGDTANFVSWGPLALGMLASPTLRDMWELMLDMQRDVGCMLDLEGGIVADTFRITGQPRFAVPQLESFLVETTFAAILRGSRTVAGEELSPSRVQFCWPAPARTDAYQAVFRCPVLFEQAQNAIEFPLAPVLIPTSDAYIFRHIQTLVRAFQWRQSDTLDIAASVSRAIRMRIYNPPDIAELAADLHMSDRTLRRHLAESGSTYFQLLEKERCVHVMDRLRNTRMSVTEIAPDAGFADARSLRRAFTRWTGLTPGAWRETS